MNKPIPIEELERYTYNAMTGELMSGRYGRVLRMQHQGRWTVKIKGSTYQQSRVIWYIVTGEDAGDMLVEHIDGNPLNNRWTNLRLATQSQNMANKPSSKGVCYDKHHFHAHKPWRADAQKDGKHYSSYHRTEEEAREWYVNKREELHGEFAPKE